VPNVVVFRQTLDKFILHVANLQLNLRYIEVPPLPIEVTYDVSVTTQSLLRSDPLLFNLMVEEYQKAIIKIIQTRIVGRLQSLDEQAGSAPFEEYADTRRLAFQSIELDLDKGMKDGDAAFAQRVQRLAMEKSQYGSYRKEVGKRVAKFSLSVGAAAVGVGASAGTFGAALPLAIVGLYRAIMEGTKLFRDVLLEAEACEKNVFNGLLSLKKTYGMDQNLGRGREISASLINSVTAFPLTTKYNLNGKKISEECALWNGKLTHLRVLAHELATDLNDLIQKTEQLISQIVGDPTKKSYVKALESVESDVELLLDRGFYIPSMAKRIKIPDAHARAEKGLDIYRLLDKALKEFINSPSRKWVDGIDFAINTIVDMGLMGASLGVGGAPTAAIDKVGMALSTPGNVDAVVNVLYEGAQQYDVKKKTTGLYARLKDFHKSRKAKYKKVP